MSSLGHKERKCHSDPFPDFSWNHRLYIFTLWSGFDYRAKILKFGLMDLGAMLHRNCMEKIRLNLWKKDIPFPDS